MRPAGPSIPKTKPDSWKSKPSTINSTKKDGCLRQFHWGSKAVLEDFMSLKEGSLGQKEILKERHLTFLCHLR